MRPLHLTSLASLIAVALAACAPGARRFPLREPMWRDTDLRPVNARCHAAPSAKDPRHVSCAPEPYDSPVYWDGADQLLFRPLSETTGIVTSGESVNVNSLDEVPDSAWFTNRLGVRPMSLDELRMYSCPKDELLDPDHTAPGSWIIDKGKTSGSSPGFQMKVAGRGRFLVKATADSERQVAASVIGEAVYYAAGYNASCEQALRVPSSIFTLSPGLKYKEGNFGDVVPFDHKVLSDMFRKNAGKDGRQRLSASAWLPGYVTGQFRYEGTRKDDPNDVVPHQDRRELRGARVLAAWIDHFDEREGNSLDAWVADAKGAPPDSSPGHIVHYQIGTSAALGSGWSWDEFGRRLGYAYAIDWDVMATDFLTLGVVSHPWDEMEKKPGKEMFGYFDVAHFEPDRWKNEYSNPAFSRMTERDGAWMARILARFTPEMVHTLVDMAQFLDPGDSEYLESVLSGRLQKILERYLTRLSPITGLHLEGTNRLCGVDLAEWRRLRDPSAFLYHVTLVGVRALAVERHEGAEICVALPHVAPDGTIPDDAAARYVRVRLVDGVASGPLIAHLYDLGPARGYRLVGLERPEE